MTGPGDGDLTASVHGGEEAGPTRPPPLLHTVAWGECDPAGILFYPTYWVWFDNATWTYMHRLGFGLRAVEARHGALGMPILETHGRYHSPTRYGDEIEIRTRPELLSERRLAFHHRVTVGERLAMEGTESRVWAVQDASRSGGIAAAPIPSEIRAVLERMAREEAL